MEFKDKVIYVRAKLNLSQDKLSTILHVSSATISRWELGKVKPSKKDYMAFIQLCHSYDIHFEDEEVKING